MSMTVDVKNYNKKDIDDFTGEFYQIFKELGRSGIDYDR